MKKAMLICLLLALAFSVQADDFLYTTNNGTIIITGYTGTNSSVTIPDTLGGLPVTSIGSKAFIHFKSLSNVTIPDGATVIGRQAFGFCPNLTSVTLPNSVTNIGDAFLYCISLKSVTIPDSVINIEDNAFRGCSSLTNVTIPSSVTSIGDFTFCCCTNLSGVYFQGNAPQLGDDVFEGCTNTVYYLKGTTGWTNSFGGRSTKQYTLTK